VEVAHNRRARTRQQLLYAPVRTFASGSRAENRYTRLRQTSAGKGTRLLAAISCTPSVVVQVALFQGIVALVSALHARIIRARLTGI
jgi:hypothetical protein